jgi:hypothetical protein
LSCGGLERPERNGELSVLAIVAWTPKDCQFCLDTVMALDHNTKRTGVTGRRKMNYLIDDLVPTNQVHVLSGSPGVGKSAFIVSLIKKLQTTDELFGRKIRRPPFIGLLVADRSWGDYEQWFTRCGIPPVPHTHIQDGADTDLRRLEQAKTAEARINYLVECWQRLNPPRGSLLLADPISAFIKGNLNDYSNVFSYMMWLSRKVEQEDWTVIGVLHGGKQKGNPDERYVRPQDRILGSAAFNGCAGTSMYLAAKEETTSGSPELTVAPHRVESWTCKLQWSEPGPTGTLEITNELVVHETSPGKLAEFAERFPAGLEISTNAIIEQAPELSRRTITNYLRRAEKAGLLKQPKRGLWVRSMEES